MFLKQSNKECSATAMRMHVEAISLPEDCQEGVVVWVSLAVSFQGCPYHVQGMRQMLKVGENFSPSYDAFKPDFSSLPIRHMGHLFHGTIPFLLWIPLHIGGS